MERPNGTPTQKAPAHLAQLHGDTPTVHEKTLPSIRKAFQGVSVV